MNVKKRREVKRKAPKAVRPNTVKNSRRDAGVKDVDKAKIKNKDDGEVDWSVENEPAEFEDEGWYYANYTEEDYAY